MNPLRWIPDLWWGTHDENVDPDRTRFDAKPLIVFLAAAVLLTVHEYFGNRHFFHLFRPTTPRPIPADLLWEVAWWSGSRVLLFLVIPSAILLAFPGERLREYGWSLRGAGRSFAALLALLVALPLIHGALDLESIWLDPSLAQAQKSTPALIVWSALVAAQIVAVEFFFRGFILGATRRSLGVHAVLAMMVPWCMFHYEKGQTPSYLAIGSGLLLGIAALRTRSIWPGIFAQAVAMAWVLELWRVR